MQSRYFKRMYEKVMASFYFRSRFLCFKRPIKKIRINSKIPCPQSPSFLVRKALPAKRNEKGYGDENGSKPFLSSQTSIGQISYTIIVVSPEEFDRVC